MIFGFHLSILSYNFLGLILSISTYLYTRFLIPGPSVYFIHKRVLEFFAQFPNSCCIFFFVFTESNQIGADQSAKPEGDDSSEVEPEAESGGVCGLKI